MSAATPDSNRSDRFPCFTPSSLEAFADSRVADLVFDIHPAFLVAIPLWVLFAWGAGVIARNRGEAPWRWVVLGLLIGPFSWLAARYSGKICLHCRSRINRLAIVCPFCQRSQTLSGAATGDLGARPESLMVTDNLD